MIDYTKFRQTTPVGELYIERFSDTGYAAMFQPNDGAQAVELHSGSDGHSAYLYICGFVTGVHVAQGGKVR